jgi:hypothetical protein
VDHDSNTAALEHLPRAPLPPIIMPNVPGTWAYDTMSRRVREEIVARIFKVSTHCSIFVLVNKHPALGRCKKQILHASATSVAACYSDHERTFYCMQENNLTEASSSVTKTKMDALHAELSTPHTSPLTAILEDGGPDVAEWNSAIMAPYLGKSLFSTVLACSVLALSVPNQMCNA